MEEIEYLEEYEDLVLPALNSAAAATSKVSTDAIKSFKNSQNQKFNDDGDDSSSSLDQDIFNCLFDDNSDDDDEDDYNIYEQGGEKNINQVEVLRQDQKSKSNTFDKEANKITSSTPKPKTFATKTSGTTISINRAQSTFANKPKSVATVRPTVQNHLYQTKQKKTNTIQRATTTSFIQQQHQQHQQRPTTSTASTSRSHQLPILARKPLSTATASSSSSTFVGKKITLPSPSLKTNTLVKKVVKRPATIVKPEKIITKDPVNDPLNLDDLSEIGSDNYSLSDISGETYNSISEFDDDDDSNDEYYSGDNVDYYEDVDDDNISSSSQIIELSNDSSGSQNKLEDLRAPTPSPIISDDSDTSSSLFNLKLRKPCSTKPYSHPIIIESVLKKGDKPKLLDLLSQYNLLEDSLENDSEEEANVVIDITRSKENLLENLEVDTAQRASSPPTPVDAAIVVENKKSIKAKPTTGCSTSSVSTDKNKSKKKRLKKMDSTNVNRDSTDSDLSAVEELLEESYAEAMKKIKDAPLSSQEVGAELEIGGEEEVTAVEVVKNSEDNKLKQTKPGIVIDYDDNPLEQESATSKKADSSSKEELEAKRNNGEEEKEKINKEVNKEIELEIKKEIGQKSTELKKIESSDKTSDLNENKSNEITGITESSSLKPTKNNEEKPSLNESIDIPMTTPSKLEDIVKEEDSAETISDSISSGSLNIRKKKRFRNLKTPDPSDPTTAILKSLDDDNDFKGFEDFEKVTEDGLKLKTKGVEEQDLDKSLETKINKAKDDFTGSFKSPTSSHKSLQDKHRETKEKISSGDSSRNSSKDRNSKESKSKSSRESSKEKSSRENSKDRSSRENSKDRSRESSKDRTKTLTKDHKDHRKSNDSKESSRSRESSKSRDSKDTKHSKSDTKEFHRHSNDKKDKTHETTKEKLVDKTKTFGSDNKDKKDYESRKQSKDDKESSEKKSDTLKPKKLTEDGNKIKAKEDDIGKTTKATPTKDFKNSNIQKKSTDSPTASSSSKNSSCSTSRDSSKDRKEVKKPMETSNESLNRNKVGNASTLAGNKMKTNKSIPTKTVSNSDEKQKEKINVTQKSSDSVKDCKPVKSDTKPVKENTDLKTQTPTPNDSKSSDSNIKNIKPNLIVKNVVPTKTTTQSPNVKPMIKSNTNLNKSTTSLNKSTSSLNKSTTSLNKSNTSLNKSNTSLNKSNSSLNKSNTGLNKTLQKPNDSKTNKDPNSKTVTADLKSKNTTAKPTTQISDKSNISKPVPTTDVNKTPKKIADDKKVLQNDDNANKIVSLQQSDKSSSDAANKSVNKTQDEPSKVHSTPDKAKGTNIIPTTTQGAANITSIKKPTVGVDSKSDIKNVKDGVKPNIVNKSPSSQTKKFIKKPDENKQKDKADISKKGDLQKQDLKPNLKTISEKPQTKDINNTSEDNDKTDKTVIMSPKNDLKPKPVIMKSKVEIVQKKCEPVKTKNAPEIKSDNVGLKKSTEIKPPVISGGRQMDKNVAKTETIKKGDVLVKSKTETIKKQQSKEKEEDIKPEATDKSDLKLKTENKSDSVISNTLEESSLVPEVKSISENPTDSTKTTKFAESSKENENKTQPKPAVSVNEIKSKSETQTDSTKTTTPEESCKKTENKTQPKPKTAASAFEVKSKSETQTDLTKTTTPEENCKENENKTQLKHKPVVSAAEVKSKSGNQTDSPKPQEICRETEKEIKTKSLASEPNIKGKILKPKKISVNNTEAKTDSVKESSKVCDKKGIETKTSKETEKPLSGSSSSNDKEVETKSSKEAVTANVKTKDDKTSETTAFKKDELKVSEKTSKITNKTKEIEGNIQEASSKKFVEMEKCNETSIKSVTSIHPVITEEATSEKGKTILISSTVKGETKINKSEPNIKPNITSKSINDQKTNELLEESTEKQELPDETEETIEPRLTRSRIEIIKANEDIHESVNSGKCTDLKLESKEVEDLKLETSKAEHEEKVKTSETTVDKDVKTDDAIVEVNQAKNSSQKCEDKTKEEDTSLKEEKANVNVCGENNPDKNELKEVEPIRTRNRSKILIGDGKTQGFETPPPLVDTKNQICDVKPEDLKLEESKAKEEVSDVITAEEVPKENKFEPIRTRKRADNKPESKSKIKEGNASEENSQSEITCEKSTIELKDIPGSSSTGIRTRKHIEIEADEKKLTAESGASTIGTKSLAPEEKSTKAEVAKTDSDNFEPKQTRKCLDHKVQEPTNIAIKDQNESEKVIEEDTVTERITENTSLETEKANEPNFEPVRTRKRGDIKTSDMELKESADVSSEDKKDSSDHTNKEIRKRKRGDVVKSVDLKQKESVETSDSDKKDQTSKEIIAETNDLKKKESAETSEKVQKDIRDQKNKEISEPITTRKRGEAYKSTDLHQKESTKTSKENEIGVIDQTNKEIIEPVKTRKRGEVVKLVNSNQKEYIQTFDEDKNVAKDQTIEEIIIEPIKTRSRGDVKATDLNTNEVLETSGRDKKDTRDQTSKEMIESVKPTKPTEAQSAIVTEKTDENKLEPIKTRKRLDINDDFKEKESKEQTNNEIIETVRTRRRIEDKNITSMEETVEDKSEHTPTRNRADNKTEDFKAIKKNSKEAGIEQFFTINDNEQSKQDTSDRTDTNKSSSDTSISSDYSLKRTLRKRGTESPLSENDNKKLFKEPTVKSIYATTSKSAKDEKPSTNVVATSLKRNLRSPVSEASSPITVKRAKLDVPRKTTRFRNLHDDCLEEEELPVITASESAVTTELENLNVGAPKELEVQEKHQLSKKSVRKEVSQSKNTESQLGQEPIQDVITDREKSSSETETKNLPRREAKEIETVQTTENTKSITSNSTANLKAKAISEEVSSSLQNNEKQNIPERSKSKKVKPNTSPTKSSGSSSVLSFSDWLKTKEQSTKLGDNLEKKSVPSTTDTEKATEKTKENIRINTKPIQKVVDAQDQNKLPEDSGEQENLIENIQEKETKTMARSNNRRGRWRNKSNNNSKTNQSNAGNSNVTTTAPNSKNSQPDVQDDNSCDSKIKIEKLQAPTPTLVRVKKREIQVLIDSMSKEMKDGGISDLLNTETHVKRQRLATKRNFSGSSEHLNTSSNITTKEATATVTSATTAGTVLSKDVPKVIEFAESTELLASSSKEFNRSPSKRKQQQNTTKSIKTTGHKSTTTDYVDSNSDMKLRKSLNPKDLTSHNSSREAGSPSTAIKLRKLPQTKETGREEKTSYIKTRRTLPSMKEPSNVQEKGVNRNISPVFKAPKPVVHTTSFNTIIGQESLEDNKRHQSRNKKPPKVVKMFKCREVRVRLNRSKVKKYLSVLHDCNNQVTASSAKTVEGDSSMIQNNADSNLRIQSVVDKRNLMDLSTDYNPNNVFVPQDSYMQTNITSDTVQLDPTLPSVSLANQSYEATPISSHTMTSLPIINTADPSEHIELKNEFMDENPIDLVNEALLPDTPTLLARAQTITEAAQHALSHSVAPTDIRLLTTESTGNAFVPSFGVIPTVLDNRGTCMYTFLHPAKYNRNHSNVLLDYCCPNLDGPMPAIDPTRIHAQVQVPVIELPASIVLTTKIVTRADVESENSTVPAIIRRKAEKIRNNLAAHHKVATAASVASTTQQSQPFINSIMQPQSSTTRFPLPPTINALTKQLPATTTITAKIRPTQHQDVVAQSHTIPNHATTSSSTTTPINPSAGVVSVIPRGPPQLSHLQKSSLRSNLRRFDVLLKQLVQPFDNLTFVDRHRIIEAIIATGKMLPKDLDSTISLMEEYIKQTTLINNDKINTQTLTAPIPLPSATTTISTNNYHMTHMTQSPNSCNLATLQMPQLQPAPQLLAPASSTTSAASSYCRQQMEQLHTTKVKKVQTSSSTAGTPAEGTVIKQRQVPIYDAERNIIGYQMKMLTPNMASVPAYTKSTMSTHTGAIMSTSLDSSSNKTISYTVSKRPVKRPAQDSPRVFYTTPPLQTSTPKGITNPPHMYPITQKQSTNSKAIAQKTQKGSIVTTLRSGGSSASSASSETITTTTMATVKRVTRSTATGSKIFIVSKSNQSNEETILPDTNNQQQPEIKNEKDIEEFLG